MGDGDVALIEAVYAKWNEGDDGDPLRANVRMGEMVPVGDRWMSEVRKHP